MIRPLSSRSACIEFIWPWLLARLNGGEATRINIHDLHVVKLTTSRGAIRERDWMSDSLQPHFLFLRKDENDPYGLSH